MHEISIRGWIWMTATAASIREKWRDDERGLTTTEWALLVAGVAALAIVVVSVVRNLTSETAKKIPIDVNVDFENAGKFRAGKG
jgi:Flp pilus assembly pilin Flp